MRSGVRARSLIVILIIVLVASIIGGFSSYILYRKIQELSVIEPAPFMGIRISFNELLDINKVIEEKRNLTLYLPTWLPDGYRLSAIWVGGLNESEWGFPIILVYSKDNYTDYHSRPETIGFEITPGDSISTGWLNLQIRKWNSSCDYIPIRISDDIYGIIYKSAASHYKGKVYRSPLAVLYVKGWSYMIDADKLDDLIKIIKSLKPIESIGGG